MRYKNKLFAIGLLAIMTSILFINGFLQINFTKINFESNLGSPEENPTFGNTDTNYTIIYGHPTELSVSKSESVTIDLFPNGTIKSERVTVAFTFENDAAENCSFNLIDRIEYGDLDSIKFQKGTFTTILPYQVIQSDEDFGVTILEWANITVKARSRAEYGYVIQSYKPIPIQIETEYYVNGSLAAVDPLKNALNTSVGSRVSNIIRVHNIQQELFSTSNTAKPFTLCLITLLLPYEEDEDERDISEPIFSTAPIMSTILGPIQQISWIALGDDYELNWTTVIQKGGGWGILEFQPIRFDIVQSVDITNLLFDGLSGLLGIIAAQQAYWAALDLMAIIEELTGMVGVLQVLLTDIQTKLGMLSMLNYSLINSLLIALVEIDMTLTSLDSINTALTAIYEDLFVTLGPLHAIVIELRTILGIGPEGIGSNSALGIGIPYMSIPLII
ncbi:MAG TPA: hypothetical protein VMV49_10895, partial [Candidatus Deferrimicrobium sp.]|nr:hypothetical protein [Candidatus Deferrimicrobium sp.]